MAENKGVLPSSNVNTLGNANNKWENVYAKKFTGAVAGNASTASSAAQLTTARSINGTNFNGTGNITTANWGTARNISIADATAANTGTGVSVNGSGNVTLKLPATIKASLTGNASTASSAAQLTTARAINGTNFNGTGNITTANWGTARNISIADATAANTGTGVSVNGSGNVTLKLPATIKASLTGNVTGNVSGSSSSCTGNSATATKATQDSAGQQINTTYIKGLSISGQTITYTKGNGGTGSITVPTGAGAKGYIVESKYNADGSWYRKWSDGWLEQGGTVYVAQNQQTVTLVAPFINNTYTIVSSASYNYDAAHGGALFGYFSNLKTTSMQVGTADDESFNAGYLKYYACGKYK